jgi:tRNA U34 5-methylaminomethyl-2-thiouridine-forming methyltransferase MnmC
LNQLFTTSDGSHTLFVPELNEHYHSIYGAVQESNHIFINTGFDFCRADPLNIFEVGFGTGLNALLTAVKSRNEDRIVNFTTIEKYPVTEDVTCLLNHYRFAGSEGKEIAGLIYSSAWDTIVKITDNFNLMKIRGDFREISLKGTYDLIYFDAFGPDKQPEMWTMKIFEKIAEITKKDGVFVTYSAKGDVKRKLKACGFNVSLLPGPPGKRQMIRAVKN